MEFEKLQFIQQNPGYGYNNQLDNIISTEYPNLLKSSQTYLDNTAIPPLPTKLLLEIAQTQSQLPWLQNPHSSPEINEQIDSIRLQLLKQFNCSALDYSVIFCSNATQGIKLVGESFPWDLGGKLILSVQNHTSMIGVREYAVRNGNSIELVNLEGFGVDYKINNESTTKDSLNLMCLSAQSNWNGLKLPNLNYSHFNSQNTITLLDFSSYCQSNALNIPQFGADFNVISFYKIFGIMTGLSCLIVKRSSLDLLKPKYFGGGNLLACDIYSNYKELNTINSEGWEFGTPNYFDILNLPICFNQLERVFGNMNNIQSHTQSLTSWLKSKLKQLTHFNGIPLVELYSHEESDYGPIITFNLTRSNNQRIDLKHISEILKLNNIIVRIGSLCNPGSNQLYLNLTSDQVRESFNNGIKCGDGEVGACRVSFGKVSRFEDAWKLVEIIRDKFIETEPIANFENNTNINGEDFKKPKVLEINIYPIKSCQPYNIPKLKPWPILKSGLKWDRKFKLINLTTMKTMIQKNYTILAQFLPIINFNEGEVGIDYKGDKSPIIKFGNIKEFEVNRVIIDDKEESIILLNTPLLDAWFLKHFNHPVGLITSPEDSVTFPNQSPILAILDEDLEDFRIKSGLNYIPSNRFRSNLILKGVKLKVGDIVKVGGCEFLVEEPCTRCSMVTIDQLNSKRDLKLYSNLIKFGSNQGFGKFGWYLKLISSNNNEEDNSYCIFNCQ